MAFYFNANACRLGNYLKLFNANAALQHPAVVQTHLGDILGKGLNQIDMAGADNLLNPVDDVLVANDVGQLIRSRIAVLYVKIDIDSHRLGGDSFEGVYADFCA